MLVVRTLLTTVLTACAMLLFRGSAHADPAEARSGELIIKFRPFSATASRQARIRASLGVQRVRSLRGDGGELVRTLPGAELDEEYAKNLLASGLVEYIEPNYILHALAAPNDPELSKLWGMHSASDIDIDAPEAWSFTTGSDSVVVGVIDTGIDANHPDLADNIWRNSGEIPGNGLDDDHNGYVDDVFGWNALNPASAPFDDNGHGTHCAGTIGATGNNGRGVVGVNWRVKLMALKFLDSSGSGSLADAIETIDYAVAMRKRGVNIRVLSNSWGGGAYARSLESAIERARNAGILFVAAAGNESNDNDSNPTYPAGYEVENVISVAAIDQNGNLASFSNYGAATVDVAAPGVAVYSTKPGNAYQNLSGTSMATPHVSGVAALVAAHEPALSVSDLVTRIRSTVKTLPSLTGVVGAGGIVSAFNALTNQRAPNMPPRPSVRYQAAPLVGGYRTSLGARVLSVDDGYREITTQFPVTFYGAQYQRFAVSANGRVVPLTEGQSVPASSDYANRLFPGINVYADDLFASISARFPDAGVWMNESADEVTFTWVALSYAHRTATTSDPEIRVQTVLRRNGIVDMYYADTDTGDPAYDAGMSATVGLAPAAGGSGERIEISHNSANPTYLGSGRGIRFTPSSGEAVNDFDGDMRSDPVVWRPETGMFYAALSGKGFVERIAYQLGLPGDVPFIVDTDGDNRADFAVWRPATGTWYFRTSLSRYEIVTSIQWGLPTDVPVAFYADNDRVTDIGVFRPGAGFLILLSSGGFDRNAALRRTNGSIAFVSFPWRAHDPVIGYFGGGSVQRPGGIFQLRRYWAVKDVASDQTVDFREWGEPGDTPCPFDSNGNRVDDLVMVRDGGAGPLEWWVRTESETYDRFTLGTAGDKPLCGRRDYNGDGRDDPAVFHHADGMWTIRDGRTGEETSLQLGLPGDVAL